MCAHALVICACAGDSTFAFWSGKSGTKGEHDGWTPHPVAVVPAPCGGTGAAAARRHPAGAAGGGRRPQRGAAAGVAVGRGVGGGAGAGPGLARCDGDLPEPLDGDRGPLERGPVSGRAAPLGRAAVALGGRGAARQPVGRPDRQRASFRRGRGGAGQGRRGVCRTGPDGAGRGRRHARRGLGAGALCPDGGRPAAVGRCD